MGCRSQPEAAPQTGQEEPIGATYFGHGCVVQRWFSSDGLADGGAHPGGNLPISARRTLRVLNGFREVVGPHFGGRATYPPCETCGGSRRLGDRGFCQTCTGG